MEGNSRVSKINVILVSIAIVSAIMAVIVINLPKLRAQIETTLKSSETIKNSYTGETTNKADISKNGDGSVIATLADDGTLTISGNGEMKDFSFSESIKDIFNGSKIIKVIIKNGISNIGKYAFYRCENLVMATLPNSITSIGMNSFERCRDLISVNLPETLTSINASTFNGCTSLIKIKIPESVTNIGSSAFDGCNSLTSIHIPKGVTNIENYAFQECSSIKFIDIPNSVINIGDRVFDGCNNLTKINVEKNNTKYIDDNGVLYTKDKTQIIKYPPKREGTEYTILEGVPSIGDGAFRGCSSLTSINVPNTVTSIGGSAFKGCSSLTSINVPNTVTSIGGSAFKGCSSLTSINIPNTVTSIGGDAFYGCSSLTSINIPEEVTSIGYAAFEGCSSLTEIKVHENNERYMEDDGVLYTKDKTKIIKYPPKREGIEYIILEGVISIERAAFEECNNLTSINVPKGVTSIESSAFEQCNNLTSINIPKGVASIGGSAFYNCSSLTSISIPEGIKSIGIYAFYSCDSLICIEIPSSVTNISNSAFMYCAKLEEIDIPEGVKNIEENAFSGCDNLKNINIPSTIESIASDAFEWSEVIGLIEKGEEIELPNLLKRTQNQEDILYTSKEFSLTNCKIEGNKIVIDEGKTYAKIYIQDGALKGLTYKLSYNEWDISKKGDGSIIATLAEDGTLNIIGTGEMKDWSGSSSTTGQQPDWWYSGINKMIKRVNISNGITNIETSAFSGCENLTNVSIPESVTAIKMEAFYRCDNLKEIKVDLKNNYYMDDEGVLYTKDKTQIIKYPEGKEQSGYTILEEVKIIEEMAFLGCNSLISINIPEGVTSINMGAFEECNNLININIPSTVTSIEEDAFRSCDSLIDIIIPGSVISIGRKSFVGCNNLTNVNIESGVTNIESSAFAECYNLININIPSSVTSIGSWAFNRCTSLTSVNISEGVASIEDGAFYACNSLKNITIPSSVISMGQYAFQSCTSLKSVNIKNGVQIIEKQAFTDCDNLKTINIPNSVTNIENHAFSGCSNLISINIPNSVTNIEKSTFNNCISLTDITIPSSVTSIGDYAFNMCYNLKEVIIPNTVTNIGNYAFNSCCTLTEVIVPKSVATIGNNSFEKCVNLETIIIPNTVTNIGNDAIQYCPKATIICRSASTAETYAIDNSINYQIDDEGPTIDLSVKGTIKSVKGTSTTITVEDELAGVVEESIKYIWSTQSENVTKEQIVNNLENGETLNINNVTGTYYLWIYAEDKLQNESIVRSEAFIIDNTPPRVSVSYNTTVKTNQNVTVTITANEKIQIVNGWILSDDGKVLIKEYNDNKTETITIKDIAGNEVQQTIAITNIDRVKPIVEVKYSTIDPTNQNVIITITANEELQKIEGCRLSDDEKVLTKEYTDNTTETITIKDIAGNEIPVEINISNIDKTAPIVTAEYLLESEEYMKVTITANEDLQETSGWTLSENKKVLTKGYSQNKTETVVIKDIAGNRTNIEIKITGLKGIFKEGTYEIKDSYITKIKPETTYEDFIKNINTTKEYNITEKNQEVTGTTLIKTGQKFIINNKTYTLVVTGDINGDGKTNIVDLSRLKLAIVGKLKLEGEYKEASDVNSNGQALQITDLSKMKLYIVGKTSI